MKALIVSDTHGDERNLYRVLKEIGPIDMLIHAGDAQGREDDIYAAAGCPVKIVLGNNDFCSELEYTEEFSFGCHKVLLTHGHKERVYFGTERLFYKALEVGADIVIYGHTHIPTVEYEHEFGVYAVNPGSLTLPRQEGRRPSYIIMETDKNGDVKFTVNYL